MTTTVPPTTFVSPDAEAPRQHPAPEADTARDVMDEAAPYGRRMDGSPKAKPGRPSGTPNTAPRARVTQQGRRTAGAPRAAAPKPPKQAPGPDYRTGILGLFQLVAAPLAMAGIRSDTAAADAAALAVHSEPVASALHDLALERPEIAAVLDRILSVGPYGALLAAAIPLTLQVLTNHGVVPVEAAATLGARPPAEMVAMVRTAAA